MPYIPLTLRSYLTLCHEEECPNGWASWSAGLIDCVPSDWALRATRYALGRLYDVCCVQQSSSDLRPLVREASDEQRALWQTFIGGLIVIPPVSGNPLFQVSLNKFVYNVRHSTEDLTPEQIHTMLLFIRMNFVEYLRALSGFTPNPRVQYHG